MQQVLTNQTQDSLIKPLIHLFQAQTNAAQLLMRNQLNFAHECLEISARAGEQLSDARTLTQYLRVPTDAGWEFSQRWVEAVGRQWDALGQAGATLNGGVDPQHSPVVSMAEDYYETAASAERAAADANGGVDPDDVARSAANNAGGVSAAARKKAGTQKNASSSATRAQ